MLNHNLQKLFTIAGQRQRVGIGLMSGTSLDGLDIALCHFTGAGLATRFKLLNFTTIAYPDDFKSEVQQVFAQKTVDLEKLTLLNAYIGIYHAELILNALSNWQIEPKTVDFIASHGQTIYHAPKRLHGQAKYPNATLQIGDADHIAVKTGIITIGDFRQKHLAAGGEGAPLALYGDVILGSQNQADGPLPLESRILLNIGGIANLTYLPGDGNYAHIICCDTGPGNTLIDAACRQYYNLPYDANSAIAYSGTVNHDLLKALFDHPYFAQPSPKTTGPELFNMAYVRQAQQQSGTGQLSPADLISTLSAFTALSIAQFIRQNMATVASRILVSGGGAKNLFVMDSLKAALPEALITDTNYLGIDPDAKEAILFGLLGNEAIAGSPLSIGNNPAVLMGKFSFPA